MLITTVDKDDAYFVEDSDIARTTAKPRRRYAPRVSDHSCRVSGWAAEHGLGLVDEAMFHGAGQGRSPRRWREVIEAGHIPWCAYAAADQVAEVSRRLAALPDPDAHGRTRCTASSP